MVFLRSSGCLDLFHVPLLGLMSAPTTSPYPALKMPDPFGGRMLQAILSQDRNIFRRRNIFVEFSFDVEQIVDVEKSFDVEK